MKKLIFILVLMPFMAFSQTFLPEVTKVCFFYTDSDERECFMADETFSIELIDNEYFLIKSNGEIKKYFITSYFANDEGDVSEDYFEIDFDGEINKIVKLYFETYIEVIIYNETENIVYSYTKREQ